MGSPSIRTLALCSLVGAAATACASGPSVRPQLSESSGAVRAAEEIGARDLPPAALQLKLAEENMKRGRDLMEEQPAQARRLLERAELNAEVAIALVKRQQAQRELGQVETELAELDDVEPNTKESMQ